MVVKSRPFHEGGEAPAGNSPARQHIWPRYVRRAAVHEFASRAGRRRERETQDNLPGLRPDGLSSEKNRALPAAATDRGPQWLPRSLLSSEVPVVDDRLPACSASEPNRSQPLSVPPDGRAARR